MSELGIVVIGRNEGERLRLCLKSATGRGWPVVYVDSGSTDGSVELARELGVEVVELDMSRPFTMARGRNAGFERLKQVDPEVGYVQFVDGDCELMPGWLERGLAEIEARPTVGIVCGFRRERYPERSIYNRLADIEWAGPVGEVKYSGGDIIVRVEAFRQVGGYDVSLIAGEDPDLAVKVRKAGWTVLRVDAEMTLHDMAMVRFGQWWRRSVRSGWAFADGAVRHGAPPERHWVREVRRIEFWGLLLPIAIVALVWPTRGLSVLLALVYPLQVVRVARRLERDGMPRNHAWLYATACVVGHFPQAVGLVRYWTDRLLGRGPSLIEYKGAAQPSEVQPTV
jgi:glycosyltransferase involved in cell wall biosynthesis